MSLCRFPGRRTVPITTQFTMTTLEELGLSKNGLSGASNPDGNPEHAVRMIENDTGVNARYGAY